MPTDVIIEPSSGQIYWNDSGGIGASQSIAISGNALDKIKVIGYGAIYTVGGNIGASNDRVLFNDSLTSTVQPGANGAALGDATYSWDVYAYNGAGEGIDYGDDIVYDLVNKKVKLSEWCYERTERDRDDVELEIAE